MKPSKVLLYLSVVVHFNIYLSILHYIWCREMDANPFSAAFFFFFTVAVCNVK